MASGVIEKLEAMDIIQCAHALEYGLAGNGVVYLHHDTVAILTTDRGGLWVHGIANRGLHVIATSPDITVEQQSTSVLKITSTLGYGTAVSVFSAGAVWFTNTV